MRIIVGAILMSLGVAAYGAPAKDSCQAQIPDQLALTLKKNFPEYRPPLTTDNLYKDVEWNIKNGGNGCLGLAIADFDGDGSKDFLVGLTSLHGEGALVVVALARGKSWHFYKLDSWNDDRARLYVATERPGRFQRTQALDGPLELGEKTSMSCKNPAALFGTTESSGVVYCFANGKWSHVWVSD